MTGNDLFEPLTGRPARRKPRRSGALAGLLLAVMSLSAVGYLLVPKDDNGRGGEPRAVVRIERLAPVAPAPVAAALPSPASEQTGTVSPAARTAPPAPREQIGGQSVEIQNGVKIYRPIFNMGSGVTVLTVPPGSTGLGPADRPDGARARSDARLLEPGPYGPLPRIGADGSRPAAVYAGAPVPDGKPKVALLVGGLGFDRDASARAAGLPAAVTLGFAPYGADLAAQVQAAREAGHEIVLQLPMQGFGKADPPAHMLTQDPAKLSDNLQWLLSRFPGYAGVSNLLGGRILADEGVLRPLAEDIATRGLYFLEDGTSAQTRLEPVARELGLSAARADVVIDARSDAAAIGADLARLESTARVHGVAIGTVIARPEVIQAVIGFATVLAGHNIALVPLSQAIEAKRLVGTAALAAEGQRP